MEAAERDELVCKEIVELVTGYVEDVLDPDERLDFERHLVYCSWCRDYVEQMRRTIELTGSLEPELPPPGLRDQLIEAFRGWRQARE